MISLVSSGGGDVVDYGLGPQISRKSAETQRVKAPAPKGESPAAPPPQGGMARTDRIADTVASSLLNRIYNAAGLSHSLSQEQGVQPGEIDTRR